jgi:hypothetical protein
MRGGTAFRVWSLGGGGDCGITHHEPVRPGGSLNLEGPLPLHRAESLLLAMKEKGTVHSTLAASPVPSLHDLTADILQTRHLTGGLRISYAQ